MESTADCAKTKTCASDSIDCYILDNNGYVIISPKSSDTGKFFGEVRGDIMTRLVQEGVYKDVTIYDYQAICFEPKFNDNSSNRLRSVKDAIINLSVLHLKPLLNFSAFNAFSHFG